MTGDNDNPGAPWIVFRNLRQPNALFYMRLSLVEKYIMHKWIMPLLGVACCLALGAAPPPATAPAPPPEVKEDSTQPGLQLSALRALSSMSLSKEQLLQIKALARGAADTTTVHTPRQLNPQLAAALAQLKSALLSGQDRYDIITQEDDVDEMFDEQAVPVDAYVQPTDVACKRVAALLKILTVGQLSSYTAEIEKDMDDPAQVMIDAADSMVAAHQDEYEALRDRTADDVCRSVMGLDDAKSAALHKKVIAWFDEVRKAGPADLLGSRAGLNQQAVTLLGPQNAMAELNNELYLNLAKLLANPQLEPMVDERLKPVVALPPEPAEPADSSVQQTPNRNGWGGGGGGGGGRGRRGMNQ